MVVLTEKFRFIRNDVFLCPWVDTETGMQKLVMQKINLETDEVEFEDSIDCINTAVTYIFTEEFEDYQNNADVQEQLYKKTLDIRSSENLKEINLTPEEKFNALKSWTAGIAEAGEAALSIQSTIDSVVGIWVQISSRLLSFMARIEKDYIYKILRKVERECKFDGTYHKSSIIANLLPVLWNIKNNLEELIDSNPEMEPVEREIVSAILAMEPPHELFEKNPQLIYLLKDFPDYLNNFHKKISQKYSEIIVKLQENNFSDKKRKLNSTDKFQEILTVLWHLYRPNFKLSIEDVKIISAILDLEPTIEIFYSNPFDLILLAKNFPEIVIKIFDIIMQNYYENFEPDENLILYLLNINIPNKIFRDNPDFFLPIAHSNEGEDYIQNFMNNFKLDFENGRITDEEFRISLKDFFEVAGKNRYDQGSLSSSGKIIIESIMKINPPFALFKNNPDYIEILTLGNPSILPEFLKTIDNEVTNKDGVRDDEMFLKLINPIIVYLFHDYPYFDELEEYTNDIKKTLFELNLPIIFYENRHIFPNSLVELIESDYIEDYSKRKILQNLLKNSKDRLMTLVEKIAEDDFLHEFNRILKNKE